jgi:hypothetical protein
MTTDAKAESPTPWYLRLKILIIAAGAIAAAIASVIGLANLVSPKDENDAGNIESVALVKPMLLSEFATESLGGELPLQPNVGSAERGASVVVTVSRDAAAITTPPPFEEEEVVETTAPATEAPTPDIPTAPATETPTPDVPTESPGASPSASPEDLAVAVAMANRPEFHGHDIRPSDLWVIPSLNPKAGDLPFPNQVLNPEAGELGSASPGSASDGEPLTPDEQIDRLLDALAAVEGGDLATLDPRGYLVTVEIVLKGYKNEQFLLTYSVDADPGGSKIPQSWAAENLAYYMTPTTQDDAGVADIWIPNLIAPGPYVVNVNLFAVNEKLKIAFGQSDVIPD